MPLQATVPRRRERSGCSHLRTVPAFVFAVCRECGHVKLSDRALFEDIVHVLVWEHAECADGAPREWDGSLVPPGMRG